MHKYRYRVTLRFAEDTAFSHVGVISARNKEEAYKLLEEKYSLQTYPRQNVNVSVTKA